MSEEFIIGLTEHRVLGYIFQAFIIEKEDAAYGKRLIRQRDIDHLSLNNDQIKLVKLTELFSEENLTRKFSKETKDSRTFFNNLDKDLFEKYISPYIDRYMAQIVQLLMNGTTRLFLRQAKYVNVYEEDMIAVPKSFTACCFSFARTTEGTRYSLEFAHEEKPFTLLRKKIDLITFKPCSFIWNHRLYVFEKINAKKLLPFIEKEFISIPSPLEDKYFTGFVLNTIKEYPVKAQGFTITEEETVRQAILSLEYDLEANAVFYPVFAYGEKEFNPGSTSTMVVRLQKTGGTYHFKKINRDTGWENKCLNLLKKWGLKENNGGYSCGITKLTDKSNQLYELVQWLNNHQEQIAEGGFTIRQGKLQKNYSLEKPELDIKINTTNDWFDIYAMVRFGQYQFPFIRLKNHILNNIREFELPGGEIAVIPDEWFTDYKDILPFASHEGSNLKIKKHHYNLLQQSLKGIDKGFFERLGLMDNHNVEKSDLPIALQASLRKYQEEGFSWLYHLHTHRFGGCLADDMGLGKTLQTLTLLLKTGNSKTEIFSRESEKYPGQQTLFSFQEDTVQEHRKPASLIVMPTSLIHNWENEIQKFAPSLKVYNHTGMQRKKAKSFEKLIYNYDIILTTYGTVRIDSEFLCEHEFFYIILDESQNIKNPESKIYQKVSRLRSQYRLTLTGTPIENSLSDLWSQINFINKGLLGNLAFFRQKFIIPIEKKNDPEQQEKLKAIIRPFVLRRTKEQVVHDLPPLTEQTRYCPMSSSQKLIYETEKSAIRKGILENMEEGGTKKTLFLIFKGLTRLRQLANHPSLLNDREDNEQESGKFDEILESLENLMAENHKVLIFSSFVKHLELVKEQVIARDWKYAMLTGQTAHREAEVKRFQNDPETRIFLISLKAGGVGLNLTAADYVFIIDPWWNPAAENQALSRAYRIGQDKKVFVYRFITEESIEEKIQVLQERKSSLAEKFINSNNPLMTMTKEDIMELLN